MFPTAGRVKGYETLKETRTRCRAALKKLAEQFECTSAELLEDMEAVYPAVTELLSLVLEFDRAYAEEKKKRALIDFSDQEHLTARLLVDYGTGERTALAEAVSSRYREILIDEYQDVNGIQDLIFQAVSRSGNNIFMVGDVKQSIYRFRLADPSIFLEKYKSYADIGDGGGSGRRIFMSANFRSKKGILDAVNFVFKNIMTEAFGEMDYTKREYLYPGRGDARSDAPAVELDVLDMSVIDTGEDEESPEKTRTEAAFVAGRIKALLDGGLAVTDGEGNERRAAFGDFAVLLRSVRDKAGIYAEALGDLGIPAGMSAAESFSNPLKSVSPCPFWTSSTTHARTCRSSRHSQSRLRLHGGRTGVDPRR
jgi:ATP-dependent helicase/nuclease subunit A